MPTHDRPRAESGPAPQKAEVRTKPVTVLEPAIPPPDRTVTGPREPSPLRADPAHNILGRTHHPLDAIFRPKTIAVIGATETPASVGRTVLWNLLSNPFGGVVFPVNPKRSSVLGIKAYPTIAEVPERVDLAVIVTPAPSVPDIIARCADAGVPGAIIISAGFKELGPPGAELERRIQIEARRGRMRIIGPNCLGVMNPLVGLNATFAGALARPGNVAFLSQSGALCTAILDWSLRELVGFSAFVSVGSMLDVGWGDLIDYLGNDPHTQSILVYMETIGDARAFLSAAREVALTRPILVIKAGRTEQAAKAAASHTGSLAGSDEVLDAAFRRSGVLRVERIADLFYMAEVLARQPRPAGKRLSILTNAGGPGVLATDALIAGGGELACLSEETLEALDRLLPPHWSHGNPVDILGDAGPDRYAQALEIAARDPHSDGLLVILTPQAMTDATLTAERLKPYARLPGKPVLASWMGGPDIEAGETILNRAGIPTFPYPDTATRVFNYLWRYDYNIKALYETPVLPTGEAEGGPTPRSLAERIIQDARASSRTLLTELESKQLLGVYNIPTVETVLARDPAEAIDAARRLGFPVVLKLHSQTITHKTDVGGVKLDLTDVEAVVLTYRAIETSVLERCGPGHFQGVTVQPMVRLGGYELIIGSSIDPQLGPVLLFGAGGELVEVFRDRSLGLPPLTTTLARRMMEQTRIYKALRGVRGRPPVDLVGLEQLLVRFSRLVVEQPWIKEIDLNPLLASSDCLVALDARVVLHDPHLEPSQLPRPAIRPYPVQYVSQWALTDGTCVTIRPIRPEDEPAMVRLHQELSERTVRQRYFAPMKLGQRVAHDRLIRVCYNDYDRELALVAERCEADQPTEEILGVGRLSRLPHTGEAEFAVLVADRWQRKGLGTELLKELLAVARAEGIRRLSADILPDNREMQRVCERLGFSLEHRLGEPVARASIALASSPG